MLQLTKFTAEHIGRRDAIALVRKLEDDDFNVEAARMDPIFTDQMIVIVNCDVGEDRKVQAAIWEVNGGACCEIETITADELEEYL